MHAFFEAEGEEMMLNRWETTFVGPTRLGSGYNNQGVAEFVRNPLSKSSDRGGECQLQGVICSHQVAGGARR